MHFAIVDLIKEELDIKPGTPFKQYEERLLAKFEETLRIFES